MKQYQTKTGVPLLVIDGGLNWDGSKRRIPRSYQSETQKCLEEIHPKESKKSLLETLWAKVSGSK